MPSQTRTRTAYPHPGPDQHRRPGVGRRPGWPSPPTPGPGSWPTACWPRTGRRQPTRLATVRAVREALRAMVVHNAGGPVPTAAGWRRCAGSPTRPPRGPASTTTAPCGWTRSPTRRRAACWPCCWWWPRPSATAPGSTSRRVQRGLPVGVLRPLAQPRGTWCDMATCGNKLKNQGVPGAAQPRRALRPAVRSSTGATQGGGQRASPLSDQCSAIGAIRLPLRRRNR